VYLAVTGVFLGTDAFISAGRLDRENELEVLNVTLSGEVDRLRLAIEREPPLRRYAARRTTVARSGCRRRRPEPASAISRRAGRREDREGLR
jgi:hypothetical protein